MSSMFSKKSTVEEDESCDVEKIMLAKVQINQQKMIIVEPERRKKMIKCYTFNQDRKAKLEEMEHKLEILQRISPYSMDLWIN